MKHLVKSIMRNMNLDVRQLTSSFEFQKKQFLKHKRIDLIIDIGANKGQYGRSLRNFGFEGFIVSFEPLNSAFKVLANKCARDRNWTAHNCAIGDVDGESEINISKNSVSSSLLDIDEIHISSAPDSIYVGKQKIKVSKLDSIFDDVIPKAENIYLKIDTQGFEKQVLTGAAHSLAKVDGLQIEMSFDELYKGQALFFETIDLMRKLGFKLYNIETGLANKSTGKLLQVDGVFFR